LEITDTTQRCAIEECATPPVMGKLTWKAVGWINTPGWGFTPHFL